MGEIFTLLRAEARGYERLAHRCDSSLNFHKQRGELSPMQKSDFEADRRQARKNADTIRSAMALLSSVR